MLVLVLVLVRVVALSLVLVLVSMLVLVWVLIGVFFLVLVLVLVLVFLVFMLLLVWVTCFVLHPLFRVHSSLLLLSPFHVCDTSCFSSSFSSFSSYFLQVCISEISPVEVAVVLTNVLFSWLSSFR